jgi:malate dehydrogenase (oxaloacetate-decarboxylating)
LDVQAQTITDEMAMAAARELSSAVGPGLNEERIVPRMDEWEIHPRVAAAIGLQAQAQGISRFNKSYDELLQQATQTIRSARETTHTLMREGLIRPIPQQ